MALSGELHYKLHPISQTITSSLNQNKDNNDKNNFLTFLSNDYDKVEQNDQYDKSIKNWSNLRKLSRIRYDRNMKHNSALLPNSIELMIKSQIYAAECDLKRIETELLSLQKSSNKKLMTYVLQYYAILKNELTVVRDELVSLALATSKQKRQALTLKDIKIFSYYLKYETKQKVCVTTLEADTSQFKRCKKAIKDNISHNLHDKGYNDIQVLNVLKIEHRYVSTREDTRASCLNLPPGPLH